MNGERLNILNDYIKNMYAKGVQFAYIGRHIKHVQHFLENCDSINKKGYRIYKKRYAFMFVETCVSTAICNFLNYYGVGFGKNTKNQQNIKPLEKVAEISCRNNELLNNFLVWLQENKDYSEQTMRVYRDSIKFFFEHSTEFSMENAKRFIKTLEMQGKSPQTIRLRITSLERFGEWLKKPITLNRPKFQRKLDTSNVPTDNEYERLINYLHGLKNKDYYFQVKILASTGVRISEFLQIKWEDIKEGEVELKCKGNKYRRIYFSKRLQKEVIPYMLEGNKSGYIANGKYGKITGRGFNINLKKWGEKVGIDRSKMHTHAFRHFFAKKYLKKTKDVVQLAEFLGHSNIDVTRVYLQKSHEEQRTDFNKNVDW